MEDLSRLPKVAIVLLNYNSFDDTSACIDSLNKCTYLNYFIIVVDNASSDDSLSKLKEEFPELIYLESEQNLGFSGGCNVGMQYAYEKGADYILLLNNDTIVHPDFLAELVQTAEDKPASGLVGGKVFYHHEKNRIWDAGGEIDLMKGHGKRHGGGTVDTGLYDEVREVTFVTGCLMLIRREVIEKIGYLPECYFFGVEEWDYSVQVAKAGYELWYTPTAVIWHKVGGAHSDLDPVFYYNFLRNRQLFMRRNASLAWYYLWLAQFRTYHLYIKLWRYRELFKPMSTFWYVTKKAFKDHRTSDTVVKAHLDIVRQEIHKKH